MFHKNNLLINDRFYSSTDYILPCILPISEVSVHESEFMVLLYLRYKSLGTRERRCLEEDEDVILAAALHNMIAFMLALRVEKIQIKRKVRRLLGKSHVGLTYSQQINDILDNVEKLVRIKVFFTFSLAHA